MSDNYFLCACAVKNNRFIAEPGPTKYLKVPAGTVPTPEHAIAKGKWVKELREAAVWGTDARRDDHERGDVLVFVHGYNNDAEIILQRTEQLKGDLAREGYKGAVMTYWWPSDNKVLNYVEDRHDAKCSAMRLVTDGIVVLAERQTPDCTINIHLLGHSTGAYVIREAFDDADDTAIANSSWSVSQIVFIAGDVSAGSMSGGEASTESLYRHCYRLTNFSNRHDHVLKLSNAKRIGMAPRVGRVGLPEDAPAKAVEVDCSDYFALLERDAGVAERDQRVRIGEFAHSWHIGNRVFARDLFETLRGDLDRTVIPTRKVNERGQLVLTDINLRG